MFNFFVFLLNKTEQNKKFAVLYIVEAETTTKNAEKPKILKSRKTLLKPFFMEHMGTIASDNYVAFTFFIGTMAMMAASVFFFLELNNTSPKWRTSVLVSGLITFIAAVHYYYMRGYNLETGESPTFFRYVDWILTVPLMCVEFY